MRKVPVYRRGEERRVEGEGGRKGEGETQRRLTTSEYRVAGASERGRNEGKEGGKEGGTSSNRLKRARGRGRWKNGRRKVDGVRRKG